jgi:hypothetical protein
MKRLFLLLAIFSTACVAQNAPANSTTARQPKLTNAKLHLIPPGAGLENTISDLEKAQSAPIWIGYSIPV